MSSADLPSIPGWTGNFAKYLNDSAMSFQANSISMTPSSRRSMKTVPPGLIPSLSRISFGITIWPFGPTLPVIEVPNGDHVMPATSWLYSTQAV